MIEQFKNLFKYKELLLNFAKKELKVKYKNSVLGFFWSLLNPIMMMLVFTFVFMYAFKVKDPRIDIYPIFILAGLLPWNFFNASVLGSTTSIVANGSLIKKVYFPRELLPISIAVANLVNFALELLVLSGFLMVIGLFNERYLDFYKYLPFVLLLLPILFIFTLGVSLLVAALNVYLRDIQHLVGIILLILFYGTPIIYPFFPGTFGKYGLLILINPMASIVLSFKNVLFWFTAPSFNMIAYSTSVAILTFLFGYLVFIRLEPDFAEEV